MSRSGFKNKRTGVVTSFPDDMLRSTRNGADKCLALDETVERAGGLTTPRYQANHFRESLFNPKMKAAINPVAEVQGTYAALPSHPVTLARSRPRLRST